MSDLSILIIGASGRMGGEVIRCVHKDYSDTVTVHAFVRNIGKLSDETKEKCASVFEGDATNATDVKHALQQTGANAVLVAIGAGDSTAKTSLRESSAKALMDVIQPGRGADNVRVVVVSALGAGGSKIKAGFGLGLFIKFQLRHVLVDHTGQEAVFKEKMGEQAKRRLLIVRPTNLTDNKAKGVDKVVEFGDDEKAPGLHIDRADVAQWIVKRLCGGNEGFGGDVNVTSA